MTPSTRSTARRITLLVAAAGLTVLAACGSDDDDASETTAAAPVTEPAPETTAGETTTPAPAGETIAVTAIDYGFEGLPAEIAAGSMLTLTNSSAEEVHELVAARLPDGETRSIEELLALPEAEAEAVLFSGGEPATVIIAPPTQPGFPVVGDGTITEPGRYLFLCAIPVGADPDEFMEAMQEATEGPPQVEGGPPHFTVGMVADVTVS